MVWSRLLHALPRRRLGAQAAAAAGAAAAVAGLAVRCEADDKVERLQSWEDRWSVHRSKSLAERDLKRLSCVSYREEPKNGKANPHLQKYLTTIIDPAASVANGDFTSMWSWHLWLSWTALRDGMGPADLVESRSVLPGM
eukprot:s3522_g6.t1